MTKGLTEHTGITEWMQKVTSLKLQGEIQRGSFNSHQQCLARNLRAPILLFETLKNRMTDTENTEHFEAHTLLLACWRMETPCAKPWTAWAQVSQGDLWARADSPGPMLTLTRLPNDTQQLVFNFVIKKPGREAEWVRHDPKQNLTPEIMPNTHRLCLSSGLKCLVSNNNETTYHWTLLQMTYFNRRETHFTINQSSR